MLMCEWDPRCAVLGRESRSNPLLVHYVGEVSGAAKQELFANAAALLLPVRWFAPVGLVMVEALACGAPVIAFPEGATAEIVIDGKNGMPVAKEAELPRRSSASDPSIQNAAARAWPRATTCRPPPTATSTYTGGRSTPTADTSSCSHPARRWTQANSPPNR